MLGTDREGDHDPWPLRPGSFGAHVVTDDPDALHARAIAAGATITTERQDTDYGSRDLTATEIEDNRWWFGTYRGNPRHLG